VHRHDPALKALIEQSLERGFLTYQMVDDYLPDEGGESAMVEQIIMSLEETGLPLINDPSAPRSVAEKTRMEQQAKEKDDRPVTPTHELAKVLIEPESPMSSRDPIRMYLSQMGNIPLLSREDEIFLAKQIEITRKRFRRKMMESDYAINFALDTLEKVNSNELPFERTLRTSDTENTQK